MTWRRFYVIAALALGLAAVVIRPPLTGMDGYAHFTRVVTLGNGLIIPATDDSMADRYRLDRCEVTFLRGVYAVVSDLRVAPGDVRIEFGDQLSGYRCPPGGSDPAGVAASRAPAADLNPPLVYAPAALGYRSASALESPLPRIAVARIVQLLITVGITWLALRILPRGHGLFVGLALLPPAAQLAGTLSADPVSLAVVFVWIAGLIRTVDETTANREPPGRGRIALLAAAGVAVAMTKPILWPILLLTLALPRQDASLRHHLGRLAAIVGPALATIVIWEVTVGARLTIVRRGGIDSSESADHLLHHPWEFFDAAAHGLTTASEWRRSLDQFATFGNLPLPPGLTPPVTVMALVSILGVALTWRGSLGSGAAPVQRSDLRTWVAIGTVVVSVLTIEFGLALSDMPTGGTRITGLQGRYLIPLVAVAFFATRPREHAADRRSRGVATVGIAAILLVNVWSLAALATTYYT